MCMYIQHIYWDIMQHSSVIVDFFKFYDVPVDMQIWPLSQEIRVEFLILSWPLRPMSCLFSRNIYAYDMILYDPYAKSVNLNNMIRSTKDQSSTYHSHGKNAILVIVFHITKSSERWIYKLLFSKLNHVMILKKHFSKVLCSWQAMP